MGLNMYTLPEAGESHQANVVDFDFFKWERNHDTKYKALHVSMTYKSWG